MSIALTDDHRVLADTASDFLAKHDARGAARALLESEREGVPPFWADLIGLGWLGLHLPESFGGSGYGLSELVVVVEQLGRAMAPGPFIPTVVTSALLALRADDALKDHHLPGLADGTTFGAFALDSDIEIRDGEVHGRAETVLGGELAHLVLLRVGDDAVVIDRAQSGVDVVTRANLDPTRRSAHMTFEGVAGDVLPGAAQALVDLARLIVSAEAIGIATECTQQASEYAKVRTQFGRPIATYQAVKHHCANMLVAAELATAVVWDAARAADEGGDQLSYTAAIAATLALPAADEDAQLNIQVHGGIGFTWEHDAHLYLRRATALAAIVDTEQAAIAVCDFARQGVRRQRSIDLPPEAEPMRDEVRALAVRLNGLGDPARRDELIDTGYVMPHWPVPWGRGAGAVEQLVIEQEFAAAGVKPPTYGITGWVILTLIQHATKEQVSRWVLPALRQDVIWCQLFSEPDAGSDAAGVKTRGTRVDGGWLVNGQKVWTSGAHLSSFGFATVRTDPDAPKHAGITTMVIDMHTQGVEVRPLRMVTGHSEFNEVFFTDVFVPDDDVVGPINGGWTVARATLGNESVSIGGGQGGGTMPAEALIGLFDAHPGRLAGGAGRIGRYAARSQAIGALNLRTALRAIIGGGPGPEGNVTKLVLSEIGHEAAAILAALNGPESAYADEAAAFSAMMILMHRGLSIAGGTSEIKRNQIGERILGLPRDPLIN
jgi:alkylation response protein AidB-like acyl-CoA dehydrogenase